MEEISCKIYNIINNNSDKNILDGKQLQKINCLEISDLLSPNMQCLLFQLYKNDTVVLQNFLSLINSFLIQLHQRLNIKNAEDITHYLLQIGASCKDMKDALTVFQKYSTDITKMFLETQEIWCHRNVPIHDETVLPLMNNALLMSSPSIRIDTNSDIEENELQKRLQFTPVEAAHKSLFLRYERLKENDTPHRTKLKENLLISRINFDDTILTTNSEIPSVHVHGLTTRKNLSSLKRAEKYSRLFSTRSKRNSMAAANSSIMSIPCSSKANSTAIVNAMEGIQIISELTINISAESLSSTSTEEAIIKQSKSNKTSEMEDVVADTLHPMKPNVFDICETVELEITNDNENGIIKAQQTMQRRRSIGDLVERYKKLLENSNHTPTPNLISYIKCDNEKL